MNRLRIVYITPSYLHQLLTTGAQHSFKIIDGLPSDAGLVAVHNDGKYVALTWSSPSFDPVPDGGPIPELDVQACQLPPSASPESLCVPPCPICQAEDVHPCRSVPGYLCHNCGWIWQANDEPDDV